MHKYVDSCVYTNNYEIKNLLKLKNICKKKIIAKKLYYKYQNTK